MHEGLEFGIILGLCETKFQTISIYRILLNEEMISPSKGQSLLRGAIRKATGAGGVEILRGLSISRNSNGPSIVDHSTPLSSLLSNNSHQQQRVGRVELITGPMFAGR